MKLNVIITGVTGMVGEGVLHEALISADVERVLVLTRRPSDMSHPKLSELVVKDFYDLSDIESQLAGYNACFFCLGVSVIGKSEEEYRHIIYDLTMSVARTLSKMNPEMVFSYISGKATDSTEHGRLMRARVKGKTENDLMRLPFKKVYAFRPGMLLPTPGMKNTLKYYKYITWLYPVLRFVAPSTVSTLKELGRSMITIARNGYPTSIIEVKDIVATGSLAVR